MNVISHFLIVFGGRTDKHDYLNDVCVFDTEKLEWYFYFYKRIYPIVHGEIPRPRYNHAATVIHNDYLAVFGGRTKDEKVNNKYFYLLRPK